MKSIRDFIVIPKDGDLYVKNRIDSDSELVLSSGIENHKNTNRVAIVVSTPANYTGDVKDGDEVIVHHNVFRKYNDIRGKEKFSSGLIREGMYSAEPIEIFAYRSPESKWTSISPYVFVHPNRTSFGSIAITNAEHESEGITEGTEFFYDAISEYEFVIEGEKMYRVNVRNICATV
jgi:hypothetical protein